MLFPHTTQSIYDWWTKMKFEIELTPEHIFLIVFISFMLFCYIGNFFFIRKLCRVASTRREMGEAGAFFMFIFSPFVFPFVALVKIILVIGGIIQG